jgi:hypothetical protein|tara:strand:+ start:108 stop:611 length:504 start_codon:yes stop_codon:yes gene_type:complete
MAYFKHFNQINYDVRGVKNNVNIDVITNLLQRVRLKLNFVKNQAFFAQHQIVDGETPEFLAYKYYGNTELHWVILYSHQATNPYYDWPLTYFDLKKFVIKKYGEANINDTHHYEDADKYEVDSTASGATAITNFLHEETLNDAKRNLTLIRPEYVSNVVKEFKDLLK